MVSKARLLAAALVLGSAWAVPALAAQDDKGSIRISQGASKAITELQTAVKANDFASVPAKAAAANAVAKTPEDRYIIAQLQLQAAAAQKDNAAIAAAIDTMLATGKTPAEVANRLRLNAAQIKFQGKDYAGAAAVLDPLVQAEPNNAEALVLLAETRNGQGRAADAVPLIQKAIAVRTAAGQPAPKEWTKRAVALAYNNKLPVAGQLALDWAKSDPSPTNWRDAIRIYSETSNIPEADQIDLYRLQRAAGALKGEADYYRYANSASTKGLPGEAKAVLDEGFSSNAIKRTAPAFSALYPAVSGKVAADKASLAGIEKTALSAPAARQAMVTGDAFLGYGEYAKAAALYRAALGKSGVDKDLANLRLGIALARGGDKAGATSAFTAVGGTRAPLAKLWLTWLGTQA